MGLSESVAKVNFVTEPKMKKNFEQSISKHEDIEVCKDVCNESRPEVNDLK